MPNLLEGKIAVVTGAGNGIGRADAIALAKQGAKVVVNDLGTAYDGKGTSLGPADATVKEIKSAGGIAVPNYDTVSTEKGAMNIIQTAIDNYGRIDVLINNAGLVKPMNNIADIDPEDWEMIMKTHLYGTFYCTKHAAAHMRKQRYGRIINTSSHVGLGWKGFVSYAAAKEGLVGFTRVVARDLAEFGVTCNAIRPIAAWRGAQDINPKVEVNRPEDIAALAVYLVSEAADHINGCIFEVWKGHVGIFTEPPPVQEIINKEGYWTTEELAEAIPKTLTKGRERDKWPKILEFF
jgi:NAD(P)-dependent dehydrogenase (short-subunit alcohol dehydrogenase family)